MGRLTEIPSRDGEMDSLYVLGYLSGIYITPFVRLAASEWFWQTLIISFLRTSIFQVSILTKSLLGGIKSLLTGGKTVLTDSIFSQLRVSKNLELGPYHFPMVISTFQWICHPFGEQYIRVY